jgi:hypothetical protein
LEARADTPRFGSFLHTENGAFLLVLGSIKVMLYSTSTLLLMGVTLLASLSACFAFGGMQAHVPACSSPLFSSRSTRTIRFNTFRDRHGEEDKDKKKDDDIVEPEIVTKSTAASTKTTTTDKKTLSEKLNGFGQSLKPKAIELKKKQKEGSGVSKNGKQLWVTAQICALWLGFIVYRAYRGFFILLPAVFRETYRKLESTVDSPFVDEPGQPDVNPETGNVRLRTRFTVSVLSAMVTLTYVIGGTINVLTKFVKSVMESGSASTSFEAAAKEAQHYEDKIRKMTDKKEDINNDQSSGLAPF